jgi:hypothetical protein
VPALYDHLRDDVVNDLAAIGRSTEQPMTIVGKRPGRQADRRAHRPAQGQAKNS